MLIHILSTWEIIIKHLNSSTPKLPQYIEDLSPTIRKYQPILYFGGDISVREIEDKQILAFKVMKLKRRQFYMRSYGNLYKGGTLDTTPAYVKVEFPTP
jgi:hypothetical protein